MVRYREGRAAEITFTYPGVTPACNRCILSRQYNYFLKEGGKSDVTSDGTPIFSTARLNATKGFILLAMLHHGTSHPRWGGMLERIGDRNLVQIRLDPDLSASLGIHVFDTFKGVRRGTELSLFSDDTVWLPQQPESPLAGYDCACPDCKGTGNLLDAIGTMVSTSILPTRCPQKRPDPSLHSGRSSISAASLRLLGIEPYHHGRST